MIQTEARARAIVRLELTHFRSWRHRLLNAEPGLVALVGPNGAGKTNILEALSLLTPGRGLRGASYATMIETGCDSFTIAARLQTEEETIPLGTGYQLAISRKKGEGSAGERRKIRIDQETASAEELGQWLNILWLTPDMDTMFAGGASRRRRFFDRLVLALYPSHNGHVQRFESLMRERSKILSEEQSDPLWLNAVESRMAEHAVAITASRLESCARLQACIAQMDSEIFPASQLTVVGLLEEKLAAGKAIEVEDDYRTILKDNRVQDRLLRRCQVGPHRSDWRVIHQRKKQAADLCSTGEQKTLLIGIILAQTRLIGQMTGRSPILILDEVAAHLDFEHRKGLISQIEALAVQCWMSGSDAGPFAGLSDVLQRIDIAPH